MKFSELFSEQAFDALPVVAGKDGRTFARDVLAMSLTEFSAAFKGSPMERPNLRASLPATANNRQRA